MKFIFDAYKKKCFHTHSMFHKNYFFLTLKVTINTAAPACLVVSLLIFEGVASFTVHPGMIPCCMEFMIFVVSKRKEIFDTVTNQNPYTALYLLVLSASRAAALSAENNHFSKDVYLLYFSKNTTYRLLYWMRTNFSKLINSCASFAILGAVKGLLSMWKLRTISN